MLTAKWRVSCANQLAKHCRAVDPCLLGQLIFARHIINMTTTTVLSLYKLLFLSSMAKSTHIYYISLNQMQPQTSDQVTSLYSVFRATGHGKR